MGVDCGGMTRTEKNFLFDLLKTPSPTGFEMRGQRVWAEYVGKTADKVEVDAYGSAWATLKERPMPQRFSNGRMGGIG